jgi:hypothetical protein
MCLNRGPSSTDQSGQLVSGRVVVAFGYHTSQSLLAHNSGIPELASSIPPNRPHEPAVCEHTSEETNPMTDGKPNSSIL